MAASTYQPHSPSPRWVRRAQKRWHRLRFSAGRLFGGTAVDRVDFMIPGAAKCGTTTLHALLSRHPQTCMSFPKEPVFFHGDETTDSKALRKYHCKFPPRPKGRVALAGEASPGYLTDPQAMKSIEHYNPQMKFVVLLRNPVDRAYSAWNHLRRIGAEDRSFSEVVRADESERWQLGDRRQTLRAPKMQGLYARYVEGLFADFGRESALVLISEEFQLDRPGHMDRVTDFLGIERFDFSAGDDQNQSDYPTSMDAEDRVLLEAFFAEDRARLESVLGRDLSVLAAEEGDDVSPKAELPPIIAQDGSGHEPLGYDDDPVFSRGRNTSWVFVLDDFYRDPDAVRERALKQAYAPDDRSHFPGMRSMQPAPRHVLDLFGALIGKRPRGVASSFQFQRECDKGGSFIHGDLNDYAAVVYLSPGADELPGTSFYRHKETGLTRIPDTFELLEVSQRLGIGPNDVAPILMDDRLAFDRWELLQTVPIRYNRLVAYDASQFHRNASAWGSTPEDSRLVQSFFAVTTARNQKGELKARVSNPAFGTAPLG